MKRALLFLATLAGIFVAIVGADLSSSFGPTATPAFAQTADQDYKVAPPAEELDARARGYVVRRRVMAVILIGGTLAGGMIASISRRRARARARAQQDESGGSSG